MYSIKILLLLFTIISTAHAIFQIGILIAVDGDSYQFVPSTTECNNVTALTILQLRGIPQNNIILKYNIDFDDHLLFAGGSRNEFGTSLIIDTSMATNSLSFYYMTIPRALLGASLWRNDESLYLNAIACGGVTSSIADDSLTSTCEYINIQEKTTSLIFNMPQPIAEHSMIYLDRPSWPTTGIRGHLLSLGGRGENGVIFDSILAYAGAGSSNGWKSPGRLPIATYGMSTVALNNNTILACGGRTATSQAVDTCYLFHPDTMYLKTTSSMVYVRYRPSLVEYAGLIYAIGGTDANNTAVSTVEWTNATMPNGWNLCQDLVLPNDDSVISNAVSLLAIV